MEPPNGDVQYNPEKQRRGQLVCVFIQAVHSQILKRLAWRRGVSMVLPGVEGSIPSEYCLMRTRSSHRSYCYPEGRGARGICGALKSSGIQQQLNLVESIQRSS